MWAERTGAYVVHTLLRMCFCELCDSKQCGKNCLLHLRGNGQGVKVSAQHLVKVIPTKFCCHQVGHGAGNDEYGRGGCMWLQNGCNRMRYCVSTVQSKILCRSDKVDGSIAMRKRLPRARSNCMSSTIVYRLASDGAVNCDECHVMIKLIQLTPWPLPGLLIFHLAPDDTISWRISAGGLSA